MNKILQRVAHQATLNVVGLMEMHRSKAVGDMSQSDIKSVTDGFTKTKALVEMGIVDGHVPDIEDADYLEMPSYIETHGITSRLGWRAYNVANAYGDLERFCVSCDSARMDTGLRKHDQVVILRHIDRIGKDVGTLVTTEN